MLEFLGMVVALYLAFALVGWMFNRVFRRKPKREQKYIMVREYYVPVDDEPEQEEGDKPARPEGKAKLRVVK